jgi:hypothetical protein
MGYVPSEYLKYVFRVDPEGLWPDDQIRIGNIYNEYQAKAVYINKNYTLHIHAPNPMGTQLWGHEHVQTVLTLVICLMR